MSGMDFAARGLAFLARAQAGTLQATFPPPSKFKKFRSAMAKARAGTGACKIQFVGDSLIMGIGALGGGTSTAGNYPRSTVARFNDGFAPFCQGVLGGVRSDNFVGGKILSGSALTAADIAAYDTRISPGAGWALDTSVPSMGGATWLAGSTITTPLGFTPTGAFDTIDIYYTTFVGGGTFTVDVDGGAVLATQSSSAGLGVTKLTVACALGTHTVNVRRNGTGGSFRVVAIDCYNSTAPAVRTYNAGWSGSKTSDWLAVAGGVTPMSAVDLLAPDLTIILLGRNDERASPDSVPASFRTNLASIVQRCLVSGDVILATPPPTNTATDQYAYVRAIADVAAQNGVPLADISGRLGTYTEASAQGYMNGSIHCLAAGYADISRIYTAMLSAQ